VNDVVIVTATSTVARDTTRQHDRALRKLA